MTSLSVIFIECVLVNRPTVESIKNTTEVSEDNVKVHSGNPSAIVRKKLFSRQQGIHSKTIFHVNILIC